MSDSHVTRVGKNLASIEKELDAGSAGEGIIILLGARVLEIAALNDELAHLRINLSEA